MTKIKWSMPLFRADPEKVFNEILAIGEEATPAQIVEAAKDESSELHKCFTWDDTEAADKWRLFEARQVARLLVTYTEDDEEEKEPIRLLHKPDRDSDTGYKQTALIVLNADEYKALLRQAKAELDAFRKKYKTIKELDRIFAAIDELL